MIHFDSMQRHWGEGVTSAVGRDEAASGFQLNKKKDAKQHGSVLLSGFGQGSVPPSHKPSTIRKRALKRAYTRLEKYGHTWYRGKLWMKPPSFTNASAEVTISPTHFDVSAPIQPREHLPRDRLQILQWNAGALSSSKYREILHWCAISWIDIAILTETHWKLEDEWSTDHFHIIHSGHATPATFDKSAGILIAISKKLCSATQIAWASIHPGRLLHCRIHCQHRPIDIVGIYQYVWNGQALQTQRRRTLWDTAQKILDSLAKRNILCFLGDFNCSLDLIPRLTGTDTYVDLTGQRQCGPQHGDKHRFRSLIQDLHLVGLNTWDHCLGPTYISNNGHTSRIDYAFTRMFHADGSAKTVGYLTEAPFLQGASYHVPMLVNLGKHHSRPTRNTMHSKPDASKTSEMIQLHGKDVWMISIRHYGPPPSPPYHN